VLGRPRDILLQLGRDPMNKIFVSVSGGCASVVQGTVPQGFVVEVVDFDNIDAGDRRSLTETARCTDRLHGFRHGDHERHRVHRGGKESAVFVELAGSV